MPQTVAELLDAALALPETERAELAEFLAATITSPPSSLHPAWAAELRRRAAEIDSGRVQPILWEEVRRQVQAQLDGEGPQPTGAADIRPIFVDTRSVSCNDGLVSVTRAALP